MLRQRFVVAIAFSVLALVGCAKKSSDSLSPPPPDEPSFSPTPTATTAAPPVETTSPPTESPTPPTLDPATAAASRVEAVGQGETYWAVYVATGDEYDSPEIDDAVAELASYGIEAFAGDLACDEGNMGELGPGAGSVGVALYFGTKAEAQTFADSLGHPVAGIARVKIYCAD